MSQPSGEVQYFPIAIADHNRFTTSNIKYSTKCCNKKKLKLKNGWITDFVIQRANGIVDPRAVVVELGDEFLWEAIVLWAQGTFDHELSTNGYWVKFVTLDQLNNWRCLRQLVHWHFTRVSIYHCEWVF